MASSVVHRALDGYRFRLSGDHDLSHPFTSVARFAVDGGLYEMTSGSHEVADGWADDLGFSRFDDEFSVQGGRLRTKAVKTHDERIGLTDHLLAVVWRGAHFSMFIPMYEAKPADAVRFFQTVGVSEHADGLTVSSRNPRRAGIAEPAEVAKEVPGLGLLEITAQTRTTQRRLPAWAGARMPSGELFRDTLDDDTPYFLLATGSAMVTVLPQDDSDSHVRAIPGKLAALKVETV